MADNNIANDRIANMTDAELIEEMMNPCSREFTDKEILEAAKDSREACVDAGELGSFNLSCENIDDALSDARELLKLWQLKDKDLNCVHVMVYRPFAKDGFVGDYIVFNDHAELYVEG